MKSFTGASNSDAAIAYSVFFTRSRSACSTCVFSLAAVAGERQEARLTTSTRVLTELMMMPEQNIPTWLLERAHAVAVIPR